MMKNVSKRPQKTKKHKKNTPESTFNTALERYSRFKKKNDKFEQEILSLIERVLPQIKPSEIEKYQNLYSLTLKIIPFFSRKSLPEYLREALFTWIMENLHDLENNPYSHLFDISAIDEVLQTHKNQHIDHDNEKQLKKMQKQGVSEEELEKVRDFQQRAKSATTPEEYEALLKESLKDILDDDDIDDDDLFDDLFTDDADTDDTYNHHMEQEPPGEHAHIDQIFKQSTINKLFRRMAKALHPDLEPDENKKRIKHQQMTKLIEAREQKDIAYLLQTYKDTFGQLPSTFPEADYTNLTKVLQHMTEQLAEEKEGILYRIPFGTVFFDTFYGPKPQQEAANVRKHIDSQKQIANAYAAMTKHITSVPKLRQVLEERMYINRLEHEMFLEDDIF